MVRAWLGRNRTRSGGAATQLATTRGNLGNVGPSPSTEAHPCGGLQRHPNGEVQLAPIFFFGKPPAADLTRMPNLAPPAPAPVASSSSARRSLRQYSHESGCKAGWSRCDSPMPVSPDLHLRALRPTVDTHNTRARLGVCGTNRKHAHERDILQFLALQ